MGIKLSFMKRVLNALMPSLHRRFAPISALGVSEYFCAAASCIYIDSNAKKATQNVTLWGCVKRNEPACGLKDDWRAEMLCDPCFIGEKDMGMANGDYTGVFPTAVEYKLAGRKPPPPTTPPPMTTEKVPLLKTTTGNGVESAFINPLLVMLTFGK
uniref:SCP domain-containing protein n=1 Tax=Globodera pallida TaxID=36090 RepID=A0A183BR10_GLOPA